MSEENKKYLQSFGRTKSRKLRDGSKRLLAEVLPRISINCHSHEGGNLALQADKIPAFAGMTETTGLTILEIGFGGGEHLLHRALETPQNKFIGCEPFLNGTVKLLREIESQGLQNIRIYNGDFRVLRESLPEDLFDMIYVLFPDPWPKKKQNKRRLINAESLEMLVRIGKNGGRLRIATDHMNYAKWIIRAVLGNGNLRWLARSKADWEREFAGHVMTKYQNKALKEGRKSVFFEMEINK